MRRMQIAGLSGLLFFLVVSLFPLASVNQASTHRASAPPVSVTANNACADSPDTCKLPVKYLGEKDGCACFPVNTADRRKGSFVLQTMTTRSS